MKPKPYKKILYTTLVLAVLLSSTSCYHVRIATSNFDPATTYKKKTVNVLLWGLIQDTRGIVASNCDSLEVKSLDEVRVSTNLGFAIITVVTLGIWCPMTVEWKCPKPCPREGNL